MTAMEMEQRLVALEKQVQSLSAARQSAAPATNKDWLLKIWGSFADDPAFEEAMKYGREWREAQRPGARKTSRRKRQK